MAEGRYIDITILKALRDTKLVLGEGLISSKGKIRTDIIFCFDILFIFIFSGDHTTGVWVGGSDNGHVGRWAWFPTGNVNIWLNK